MTALATTKIMSVLLVGIVLAAYLSPVAAGMLVCVGDGTAQDCCRGSKNSHQPRLGESKQLLARADCDCCITVDAIPSIAGTPTHKTSLDVAAGPPPFRSVFLASSTRLPRAMCGDSGDAILASLRTVVLLV